MRFSWLPSNPGAVPMFCWRWRPPLLDLSQPLANTLGPDLVAKRFQKTPAPLKLPLQFVGPEFSHGLAHFLGSAHGYSAFVRVQSASADSRIATQPSGMSASSESVGSRSSSLSRVRTRVVAAESFSPPQTASTSPSSSRDTRRIGWSSSRTWEQVWAPKMRLRSLTARRSLRIMYVNPSGLGQR